MFASIPSPPFNDLQIGPLTLTLYGLMIGIGAIAAVRIAERRWQSRGGNPEDIAAIAMWAVVAGLAGARLYHVATDWRRFEGRWFDVVAIWEGGLGIPGGLAAGVATGAWLAHRRGLSVLHVLDAAAPAIPVAQAIGRLGNWFNQELFGGPSDLPWALRIDPMHRPRDLVAESTYHPTFLYEALGNLALAALLVFVLERRFRLRPGQLFLCYVAGYAALRFVVESVRIDPATEIFGIRVNLWVSAITFACAIMLIVVRRGAETVAPASDGTGEHEPSRQHTHETGDDVSTAAAPLTGGRDPRR